MIDKIEAIVAINPNAEVSINADDYDQITWGDTPVISLADIEAKQAELEITKANEAQAKLDLKASAKAKLVAGEPLTEAEADTLVI